MAHHPNRAWTDQAKDSGASGVAVSKNARFGSVARRQDSSQSLPSSLKIPSATAKSIMSSMSMASLDRKLHHKVNSFHCEAAFHYYLADIIQIFWRIYRKAFLRLGANHVQMHSVFDKS